METELKLALAPDQQAALRSHALLADLAVDVREMHSRYLDTPEHDLRLRRVALRLRHTGRGWVQTLKAEGESAGALSRRYEWEIDLPGPQFDFSRFPQKAQEWLADIDPARLVVQFETRFRREIRLLDYGGARIELALDNGEVKSGHHHARIHEVELELKKGEPAALFELALALAAETPLSLEPASKAQRGWQLAGVPLAPPLKSKDMPVPPIAGQAHQAWQAMLHASLTQLSANFSGAIAGQDVEYLHQLRVALRRLLTAAQLAEALDFPEPAWIEGVGQAMDAAAAVRDWDVFIATTLPRLAKAAGSDLATLLQPVEDARLVVLEELARRLRAPAFTRALLLLGLDALRPLPAGKITVQAWAREVLEENFHRVRKMLKRLESLDAHQRHRLRLRIKRLRYTVDAFVPLWGEAARGYGDLLARLQDGLGVVNDLAVAETLLQGLDGRGEVFVVDRGQALRALSGLRLPDDLLSSRDALRHATPFWRAECS